MSYVDNRGPADYPVMTHTVVNQCVACHYGNHRTPRGVGYADVSYAQQRKVAVYVTSPNVLSGMVHARPKSNARHSKGMCANSLKSTYTPLQNNRGYHQIPC